MLAYHHFCRFFLLLLFFFVEFWIYYRESLKCFIFILCWFIYFFLFFFKYNARGDIVNETDYTIYVIKWNKIQLRVARLRIATSRTKPQWQKAKTIEFYQIALFDLSLSSNYPVCCMLLIHIMLNVISKQIILLFFKKNLKAEWKVWYEKETVSILLKGSKNEVTNTKNKLPKNSVHCALFLVLFFYFCWLSIYIVRMFFVVWERFHTIVYLYF